MKTLLIKNASYIYTFDDSLTKIENGYIFIKDNEIIEIGRGNPDNIIADQIIDATGKVVLPGLINVHHHFYQNITRNIPEVQSCSLYNWLKYLYTIWVELDEEMLYQASRLAMSELLLTGATTSLDFMYLFPNGKKDLIDYEFKAASELGMRFHGIRGCISALEGNLKHDLMSEYKIDTSRLIEQDDHILHSCESAFNKHHDVKKFAMTRVGVGPTTVDYVNPNLMKDLKDLATKKGGLCHTHLHPRPDELIKCQERFHCTPLEYLEDIGWLDSSTSIAHATLHTKEDIRVLSRNGACVTHSPSCHMRLGAPVAPILEMLEENIIVGIGVDGGASNDSGDMLSELRTTMLVHRIQGVHAQQKFGYDKWLKPTNVFWMATRNGAKLLNRDDIGSLEIGKAADIIIYDLLKIQYAGALSDPLGALVYCGYNHIVDTSIVNGEVVVRNGKLTRIKEDEIVEAANKMANNIIKKRNKI